MCKLCPLYCVISVDIISVQILYFHVSCLSIHWKLDRTCIRTDVVQTLTYYICNSWTGIGQSLCLDRCLTDIGTEIGQNLDFVSIACPTNHRQAAPKNQSYEVIYANENFWTWSDLICDLHISAFWWYFLPPDDGCEVNSSVGLDAERLKQS